ncbi:MULTISPECIES: hypothetical protein [unclassified Methylobacterium]|uniref:hypothetical protein n=1 Tax=unclassified Methylobacterium TaxID=2615210 RepID=UPI001FBB1CC3|nr:MULTISPECIES: hypothetical protein [unclassified Methylobacterium]MCJ2093982.1 hypothetical protein [Methylobacterium sp. J-072]MCJ2138579.1 hypothetical protein [Methylobacterium sp. E-066]
MPRRRATCHHEAGHAFVRWFFGFRTDRAVVQTGEEIRAGKRLRGRDGGLFTCHGMVSGEPIHEWPFRPWPLAGSPEQQAAGLRWWTYRRDVELIHCYAGFHAEAHYQRVDPTAAMLGGGGADMERFSAIMEGWSLDKAARSELEAKVDAWTRGLVRSPLGSAAIQAVASALMARGRLSGAQIAILCRQTYGGRECAFEAWATCWPPTMAQIRAGYIPERSAMAAA